MEADTLNEPSVLQVFSIDVRFIYWWIFILACCTFGLVISPAKRYWRTIKESSLDTKVKDSNKQVIVNFSLYEAMNLIIVTLPLIGFKDEFAMQLDDVMDSKRCPWLVVSFLYTAFVVLICRSCNGIMLGLMAKGAKRSRAMVFVWGALCLLVFVVLATFILSPFTFVSKNKNFTLGSYIWLLILISNVSGQIISNLYFSLFLSYAPAAPEEKFKQLRSRVARASAIGMFMKFTPFFLPLVPPVLGTEFHTGITWLWLIASYQFLGHFSVTSLLSLMAKLNAKKNETANNAVSAPAADESTEPLISLEDNFANKESTDTAV